MKLDYLVLVLYTTGEMGKLNCEHEPVDVSNPRKLTRLLINDGFDVVRDGSRITAKQKIENTGKDTGSLTIDLGKPHKVLVMRSRKS